MGAKECDVMPQALPDLSCAKCLAQRQYTSSSLPSGENTSGQCEGWERSLNYPNGQVQSGKLRLWRSEIDGRQAGSQTDRPSWRKGGAEGLGKALLQKTLQKLCLPRKSQPVLMVSQTPVPT